MKLPAFVRIIQSSIQTFSKRTAGRSTLKFDTEEEKQRFTGSFYIIATLLTVSFFGIFAINPTISTISQLNKQYQDDTVVDQALQQKQKALDTLGQQYTQILPDIPPILLAIHKTSKVPYLTREVELLASDNTVQLEALTFNPVELYPAEKNNAPLYSFTFTVIVGGGRTQVDNFIRAFIHIDRIITIDNMSAGKSETSGFQATITGRAYFYGS